MPNTYLLMKKPGLARKIKMESTNISTVTQDT